MTCAVLCPSLAAHQECTAAASTSALLDKPLLQRACNEHSSKERQQKQADRPASCMSDHSQPYAWNPSSQRYERPSTLYGESQHHQDSGHQEQQEQRYAPAGTLNPPQHPHPEDWNPWAYLESSSERAYTPSQPAVGGARGALPDLPAQYDPYRLPSIQQQGIADAYDPHEYQGSSGSSYVPSAPRPPAAVAHQGQLPYLDENYNTAAYSDWSIASSSNSHTRRPLEKYTLPPLDHPVADSATNSTSVPRTEPPYTSYARLSGSSRDPRSASYSSRTSPASQAHSTFQTFDSSDRRSTSLETGQYLGWTTSDTTISIPEERRASDPFLAWERFQAFWREYIQATEDLLIEQALRGELAKFKYHNMAQPPPTLASCEVSFSLLANISILVVSRSLHFIALIIRISFKVSPILIA
jgi:hypothetical protein